ncbi:MaoC/PaaZ C-terminal domain-containing protein [Microcella pacifica]|uniref:Enoyl-CoA hydratase n=1 Tax=Microcella pacifica TaxID=2591847 RepID=A0A9E5JKI6_9MICO|nr:MaoC/PaaZ C-terminal domain-containing protein [Microcella pacifica]NHF62125.1 enoyl-CoA hydratase [Microcella pacifica]
MSAGDWIGRDLGERTIAYSDRDVILYALAVGAAAHQLDLVFEDRLRVLPTFGLTLAQWAPDVMAEAGAFGPQSVHGSQNLQVHAPLERSGELRMRARVGDVWDKGSAAVYTVIIECDAFTATWGIFAPGQGGFGGDRGPSSAPHELGAEVAELPLQTVENQAALYRLTGDRHHIHIDPDAAAQIGQPRPILQGLCTLAAATLPLAAHRGAHPADLTSLDGRFSGMVLPGDMLTVVADQEGRFSVLRGTETAISHGRAVFS